MATSLRAIRTQLSILLLLILSGCGASQRTKVRAIWHPLETELRPRGPASVEMTKATRDAVCFRVEESTSPDGLAKIFTLEAETLLMEGDVSVVSEERHEQPFTASKQVETGERVAVCKKSDPYDKRICREWRYEAVTQTVEYPATRTVVERVSEVCFNSQGILSNQTDKIEFIHSSRVQRYKVYGRKYVYELKQCTEPPCLCDDATDFGRCETVPARVLEARPADAVCNQWRAGNAWSGTPPPNSNSCQVADARMEDIEAVLRRINMYRWLAGLDPVDYSGSNSDYQSCAVIQSANKQLSHYPPASSACFQPKGAAKAAKSNLSKRSPGFTNFADGVRGQMSDRDPKNARSVGHRRWLLANRLRSVHIGAQNGGLCIGVFDKGKPNKQIWSAYPNPGFTPVQLTTDPWSFQYPATAAEPWSVEVRSDAQLLPVQSHMNDDNIGGTPTLIWKPVGWKAEVGKEYQVTIQLPGRVFGYIVKPTSC